MGDTETSPLLASKKSEEFVSANEEFNCPESSAGGDDESEDDYDGSPMPLTVDTALILATQIEMNMRKHNIAFIFFEWKNFWFFTLPQAVLTALASVLAFSASSALLEPHSEIITLMVGSMSAFVVLLQTVNGTLNFGVRADRHNACGIALRDLRDDMVVIILQLEEIEKKSKSKRKKYTGNGALSFQSIQKSYKQCLSSCSSAVPMAISEAFQGVDSNINIAETQENQDTWSGLYPGQNYQNMIKDKAYDILAGEIIGSWLFPAQLPSSVQMVKQTMTKLKFTLRELQSYGTETREMDLPKIQNCFHLCTV